MPDDDDKIADVTEPARIEAAGIVTTSTLADLEHHVRKLWRPPASLDGVRP